MKAGPGADEKSAGYQRPAGRGVGRPAHAPAPEQRELVATLASFGVPEANIAVMIGISEKTLRKYYHEELAKSHIEANAKVANNLFKIASTGNSKEAVTAAIFWLKTRARWSETVKIESSGPNGGPLQYDQRISLDVSDDELVRRYQEAVRVAGPGGQ